MQTVIQQLKLPMLIVLTILFSFTSCEEDESQNMNGEDKANILQNFAKESGMLWLVERETIKVLPGTLPYINGENSELFSPENMLFFIPEEATSDGMVKPEEMLALIQLEGTTQSTKSTMPDRHGPLRLKEAFPGSMWWRFTGGEFFPGSQWNPTDGETEVPGDSWIPDDLGNMEIFFYNGDQPADAYFGTMDMSEHEIHIEEGDSATVESAMEHVALAVPANQLINIKQNLSVNLAEVLYEPMDSINIPTETGSSIPLEGSDGVMLSSGSMNKTGNNPFLVTSISGDHFFPDDFFTPTTVSVFTAPMHEVFLMDDTAGNNTQIAVFGNDYYVDAPNAKFSVTEPGEELNVENTRVLIPNSIMNNNSGLTIMPSPMKLNLRGTDTKSYFPDKFYHPSEFSFPDDFFTTGTEFYYFKKRGYAVEQIESMAMQINVSQ